MDERARWVASRRCLAGGGEAVSFRLKLLLLFSATIIGVVGVVGAVVSVSTRSAFGRADEQRTDALVAQFRAEFARRGEELARAVDAIVGRSEVVRMAA